ncbi:uncharacterized protein LOC117646560 [Thrips palmi]|uniref:Uncharacterized protein LOC117646560 n=1 Tax=Thrips palmi TaxID=161013 RepID=A0A6P8Z1J1_THRPL|nr:uncharacterized protein LOC117646560 [Thrips palmi]
MSTIPTPVRPPRSSRHKPFQNLLSEIKEGEMPPLRARVVRRFPHALVFVENPPSVEIIRQDQFLDEDGAFEVGARRRVKQKSWKNPLDCVILEIGTKIKLQKLKVKPDGTIHVPVPNDPLDDTGETVQSDEAEVRFIGSRYSEQLKQKQQAAQARQDNLETIAMYLTDTNPVLPLPPQHNPRKPLVHSAEVLAELKEQLSNLSCWTKMEGDVEISPGTKVFYNGSNLCLLNDAHRDSPSRLLGAIIKALIPPHIRANRALTYSGGNGESVGVPTQIVAAARGMVQCFFKLKEPLDTARIVASLLAYSQRPKQPLPVSAPPSTAGVQQPIYTSSSSSAFPSSSAGGPIHSSSSSSTFSFGPQGPAATVVQESQTFTLLRSATETLINE